MLEATSKPLAPLSADTVCLLRAAFQEGNPQCAAPHPGCPHHSPGVVCVGLTYCDPLVSEFTLSSFFLLGRTSSMTNDGKTHQNL